jgi:hypothetical protein
MLCCAWVKRQEDKEHMYIRAHKDSNHYTTHRVLCAKIKRNPVEVTGCVFARRGEGEVHVPRAPSAGFGGQTSDLLVDFLHGRCI